MSENLVRELVLGNGSFREVNGVRIYDHERIVAYREGEFIVVIQAHTENAWRALLEVVRSDPGKLREIVSSMESEPVVSSQISFMRIKTLNTVPRSKAARRR